MKWTSCTKRYTNEKHAFGNKLLTPNRAKPATSRPIAV